MFSALKRSFLQLFAAIFAVAFLSFAMVNRETVTLDLSPFPYLVEMRLFLLIGFLLMFGIILGWLVASGECRRRYLLQKTTKQRVEALENEVKALRARSHLPDHSPAHSIAAHPSTPRHSAS